MVTIYNPETYSVLCNIVKVTSVQWTRKFYDSGGFEIYISPSSPYTEFLKSGNLLCYRENTGIIRYVKQNKEEIIVCGNDLKSLLGQRVIVPPFVYKETPAVIDGYERASGTVEEIMRYYVSTQAVNPTDTNRKFYNLYLRPYQGLGKQAKWQSRFENLLDELSEIGRYDEIGFDIVFDKTKQSLYFQCSKGRDLTKSVVFSRDYKNIEEYEYVYDDLATVNTTYAGGDGEEESQYIEKVSEDNYIGLMRREDFISVSGENIEDIQDRGLAHLKETAASETVETEANTKLKYKEDWDLGDYVTIRMNVLGETVVTEKQITEVKEVYEHSNVYAAPVFGNKKGSIIKKIMKG